VVAGGRPLPLPLAPGLAPGRQEMFDFPLAGSTLEDAAASAYLKDLLTAVNGAPANAHAKLAPIVVEVRVEAAACTRAALRPRLTRVRHVMRSRSATPAG
jgi:hypothetical protein